MTSVDRVKTICKERKIPISRLEKIWDFPMVILDSLEKECFLTTDYGR